MATKKKTDPQYMVIESYTANINNKPLKANRGDVVTLTPTQYAVLKRFVLAI